MKRLASFLKWAVFAFVFLPILDKHLGAQQGRPPLVTSVQTDNEIKLDPKLGWISEYHAPFIYQLWWRQIADCEGLPLPADSLKKVQYFQVNEPDFIPDGVDAIVYAVTFEADQTFIAYPYIWNESLVKHEALHLLLRWKGDPNWYLHDPVRFSSCGLRIAGQPPPNP